MQTAPDMMLVGVDRRGNGIHVAIGEINLTRDSVDALNP